MITAIKFRYHGKDRVAFPKERDVRNEALLFCLQMLPERGPRSYYLCDMQEVEQTDAYIEEAALDRELKRG